MIVAGTAASGSWLFAVTVSDAIVLRSNTLEGYCGSHTATPECYRRSPFVTITSVGSRFNETDHRITNGTGLNALFNIAGGGLTIFQSWEGALCICSLLKRKSVFHKIWPCGLKPSFFVPWNSRVWLYISGQLSSTVSQKLTKPVKWAMIRRQHTILQFTLYPAFASDFGVRLLGWGDLTTAIRFPNMRTTYQTNSC